MRTKEMRTGFISKIIRGNVQEYRRHKLKNQIYDYFIDNGKIYAFTVEEEIMALIDTRFNDAPDRQPEDY